MERHFYVREVAPLIIERLNASIADALQLLLETRHLYQRISVDPDVAFAEFENNIYGDDLKLFAETRRAFAKADTPLLLTDRQILVEEKNGPQLPALAFLFKSVKLYCSACETREAFRPVAWSDLTSELRKGTGRERISGRVRESLQVITVAYQCQRCVGEPNAFLIRRDGWQLVLDGRSPFEQVEVPPAIPKPERRLYRDAIVAEHGGKVLAALFYLRACIEQFARRQTNLVGRVTGDELMAAYNDLLPPDQRAHMPSLKEWYDRISEALHAAKDEAPLFSSAHDEILRHFEFRRLFRIAER